MFILLGKARKDLKKLLNIIPEGYNSIPAEKKKEIWESLEKVALQALKIYIEGQVNKR